MKIKKMNKLPEQKVMKAKKPGKMRLKKAAKPSGGVGTANKPKKKGKITRRKGGLTKSPQSDRVKQEIKTEQMVQDAIKEGMEKARMQREMKINKAIKRIK